MSGYNYRWSVEHQKERAEENLINFIKDSVSKYSPFYIKWLKDHNIDVSKIKSIQDIQQIPIVTKENHVLDPTSFIMLPYMPEWWECLHETNPLNKYQKFKYWLKSFNQVYFRSIFGKEPIGNQDRAKIEAVNEWLPIHFHNTGSASDPLLIAYSKRDLLKNIPEIVAQIYTTGFEPNWEVFNFIPASPSIGFFQSVWTPLTVGGGTFFSCGEEVTTINSQINLANRITFEVFLGTPSYITYWLTKAKEKMNKKEISQIKSVKLCILTGEILTRELKDQIKVLFNDLGSNPKIIESYSNNRMKVSFIECSENAGIHLNPRYFHWEILDPKTLEPIAYDQEGYLSFSHIDWRGSVFIRFNTGDLIKGLEWKTCEYCGLTLPIIKGPIIRSKDDIFTMNRKKISKNLLESSIKAIEGINLFQIIITLKKIDVFVNIEPKKKSEITASLNEIIKNTIGIEPIISFEEIDVIREKLFSRGIMRAEHIIVK